MKIRSIVGVCAILLQVAGAGAAQTSKSLLNGDPEPFRIEPGMSFSASGPRIAARATQNDSNDRITADLLGALKIISENHAGSQATHKLVKSAIEGMLQQLDPHSTYFDPTEFRELLEDQHSEYFGIGTTIAGFEKYGELNTYVLATFAGSPAAKAGLRFGDLILEVNGEKMTGLSSEVVRDRVRGRAGTVARITILRASTGKKETFPIRRARVPQPSIPDSYIIRPGIGYVDMSAGFNYTTSSELAYALAELKRKGMRELILDLRGNSGGILEQAVKVAERFIPSGSVIVSQRGRLTVDTREWRSANRYPDQTPVVVLVDENSASASEIVAGAFQDHDRGLIVGEKTFGKGLVQSVLDLPAGAGLAITSAKYYTPAGRSIQRNYSGSLYDYYNRRGKLPETEYKGAETATHRIVYGGDGITPDEVIKAERLTPLQSALIDPLFFFSVELANGRVTSAENALKRGEEDTLEVTALAEFEQFLYKTEGITAHSLDLSKHSAFVVDRLKYYLAMASGGVAGANRAQASTDKQIQKAIELLPKAAELARAARRTLRASAPK